MEIPVSSVHKEDKPKITRNIVKRNPNLKKRQPPKPERGQNVLYVSTKTKIQAVLDKCNKLISDSENEIIIYCLGAAIQRGILIALKVCQQHVSFGIHANTFTTEVVDDLEPAGDDEDFSLQTRNNSALRIKIFQRELI